MISFSKLLGCIEPTVDPCDLPSFCLTGTYTAYPANCTLYKWCVNGQWVDRSCPEGTLYNSVCLECTQEYNNPVCAEECPIFTGSTTIRSTTDPGNIFSIFVHVYCFYILSMSRNCFIQKQESQKFSILIKQGCVKYSKYSVSSVSRSRDK